MGFTDYAGGTAGSAKPPVLLSSVMLGLPELFLPQGVRQTSTDLELLSVVRSAVNSATDSEKNRAVIDWFRLLWFENQRFSSSRESKILERSHYLGRTGRHRRISGNRSVPNRFLSIGMVACHFKLRIVKSQSGYCSVDWFSGVGFILRLKPQVFSLNLII